MSTNTLSLDSLFDTDDLFGSAATYEATLNALDAPVETEEEEIEKIRIRAYSEEYYQWIGKRIPTPEKSPEINAVEAIVESVAGTHCKACNGTGLYRIHKHNKDIPCAKCAGKGKVTAIDEARSRAYAARRAKGLAMSTSHTDYLH